MTVNDIFNKIKVLNVLEDKLIQQKLTDNDFDTLIEIIQEYREELLHRKVV